MQPIRATILYIYPNSEVDLHFLIVTIVFFLFRLIDFGKRVWRQREKGKYIKAKQAGV